MNGFRLGNWGLALGFFTAMALTIGLVSRMPKFYISSPSRISPWNPGLVPYFEDGKFGYRAHDGSHRIAPRFDGADGFSEGRARVLVSGRFGFIDSSGSLVIPARFNWASSFRGGYTSVWTGNGWNYLDKEGRLLALPNRPASTIRAL